VDTQGELERRIIPAFSRARNSSSVTVTRCFSGSSRHMWASGDEQTWCGRAASPGRVRSCSGCRDSGSVTTLQGGGGHVASIRSAVFPGLIALLHEVVKLLVVGLTTSRMYLAIFSANSWSMRTEVLLDPDCLLVGAEAVGPQENVLQLSVRVGDSGGVVEGADCVHERRRQL
jgi:hypothetical protein